MKNSVPFVWRWGKEKSRNNLNQEIIGYKTSKGIYRIVQKMRSNEKLIRSLITGKEYTSRRGTAEVEAVLEGKYFSFPKPLGLIKKFLMAGMKENSIMMDFFAGSSTNAHAVMQLNAEYGGSRKYIMVQFPESCNKTSEAFKAGYKTIAEISKERIRRAGKKIKAEYNVKATDLDIGFRVLKIDSSNMKDVYYTPDTIEQAKLFEASDNIKEQRTSEDLLFQVLLDRGIDLTLPIQRHSIENLEVFCVDDNTLIACFEKDGKITEELCKTIAKKKPRHVIFRDSGFQNDSMKINVEQIFKLLSPNTDVKTI